MTAKDDKVSKKIETKNSHNMIQRIHINEFLMGKELSTTQQSGFKVFVGGKVWMYKEEWEKQFTLYQNRDKKK